MGKKNSLVENKSIVSFFTLEIMGLIAFNFGNLSKYLTFFGFILSLFALFILLSTVKEKRKLLILLIPIFILLIISGINAFGPYSQFFQKNILDTIIVFVSLPSIFLLGYACKNFKDVKSSSLVLILGGALAAVTLFGLISTIIEYGFFYSARFKNTPYYYYQGSVYDVTSEMYWLNGFGFKEASIKYGSLYALLSASFLVGLMFINRKENKIEFYGSLAIGIIGLLTLLVLLNFEALLVLLFASLGAFILKYFAEKKKLIKSLKIGLFIVGGLGLLFFALAIVNASIGYKFPGFLSKIFEKNEIMAKVNPVLETIFDRDEVNLFGLKNYTTNVGVFFKDSNVFEVQILKEVGLLGTILFLGLLVYLFIKLFEYLNKGEDSKFVKAILLTVFLSYFIYSSFANTITPFTHDNSLESFLRSPSFYTILFLFGFVFDSRKGSIK